MILPKELQELKNLPNWVCYKLEPRPTQADPEHLGKVPYNPKTGYRASAKDPRTWADYETAVRALQSGNYAGIGFELGNSGYCGIDLDKCVDTSGRISDAAADIVARIGSYTEYSISGTGLHILTRTAPMKRPGYNTGEGSGVDIEIYRPVEATGGEFAGEVAGGRFLTISGNVCGSGRPIEEKTAEVRALIAKYWPETKESPSVGSVGSLNASIDSDADSRMIQAALDAIDPAEFDFGQWAAIVTAMKYCGFSAYDAEAWSSKYGNPKHVPGTIAKRWERLRLPNGDTSKEGAAAVIMSAAQRQGWKAADAFTDEERRQYGIEQHKDSDSRIDEAFKERMRHTANMIHENIQRTEEQAAHEAPQGDTAAAPAPGSEPAIISAEEWGAAGYYAVAITADPGRVKDGRTGTVVGYEAYRQTREEIVRAEWHCSAQRFQTEAEYLQGLLTYDAAVNVFQTAEDKYIELPSFPELSKIAKIRAHSSVVLAADTGAGKSSLAINFLNELNDKYPVLYINLEMDNLTILQRLVSIRTGMELDRVEGYKKDEHTADVVNSALRGIASRQSLQVRDDLYMLEDIEKAIQETTEGRTVPTIVIIDHCILLESKVKRESDYSRFTYIAKQLRKYARQNNIVLFELLQQNREGKKTDEKPKNSSLKESGEWENSATHIMFLWNDPALNPRERKRLLLTKNRGGALGEFVLRYFPRTQTYREDKGAGAASSGKENKQDKVKQTSRDKKREMLQAAYDAAMINTNGRPTLYDIAEAAGVMQSTVKSWIKEFGGATINGLQYDPAGIDKEVEYNGYIRLTISEEAEVQERFEGNGGGLSGKNAKRRG